MKTYSLKELLEEDNQIPYTIPGLLPIGLITLSGAKKVGKTWLTLKLAIDASQGNPVFGAFPCQPKRVFYYAYKNERGIPLFDRCLDLGLHTTMSGLGTHLSNCQNGTGIEIEVCKRFNLKHIKKIIEEDKTEILIIDSADTLLNKPETLSDLNYLTRNNDVSIILTTTKELAQIGFKRASYLSKANWTLSSSKAGGLQLLRNGGEDETPVSLSFNFSETFTEVLQGWGRKPVNIEVLNNVSTETKGGYEYAT